jgi:hypothetical protein
MTIKKSFLNILVLSLITAPLQAAKSLDPHNSLVVSPRLLDTVIVRGPVVVGVVTDASKKPVKNSVVTVYVDKKRVAVVPTNKYGVWSCLLNESHLAEDSAHIVEACATLSANSMMWTQAAIFYVQSSRATGLRSGIVDVANSSINYPFGYVNTTTPVIVGTLLDSHFNPVSGQTVQVKINNVTIATVTSDSNGVFSYQISSPLSEGTYTVGSHCVQSAVDLTANAFTVSTTPPAAPVIVDPVQDAVETYGTVTLIGTTEPLATVTTFMDGNAFGDISYADEYGNWSIQYTLSDGSHSVTAQATDLANNTGAVSAATNFTVNT